MDLYRSFQDLIGKDIITFEIRENYQNNDDNEFSFSPIVQFSNEEY